MLMTALWLLVFTVVFAWSAINPADTFTWFLEVLPAVLGLVVLALTRRVFPLTALAYVLVLVHCVILMIGGHYTYAEVPLFDWLAEQFGWQRNHYDKVGHFAQGFIPAILAREILLRKAVVNGRGWLNFYVVCFCLAFSAFYELIEWQVALLSDEAADKPFENIPDRLADTLVIAEELTPGELAILHERGVAGIVTEHGGPHSHTAILANSLGKPTIQHTSIPTHTTVIRRGGRNPDQISVSARRRHQGSRGGGSCPARSMMASRKSAGVLVRLSIRRATRESAVRFAYLRVARLVMKTRSFRSPAGVKATRLA